MNLEQYINNIADLNPMNQEVPFNIGPWQNNNLFNNNILGLFVNISDNFQDVISRENIINFFSNHNNNLLEGFLMSMIWGFGEANYGPSRVSKMLNIDDEVNIILNNAKVAISENGLIEAYNLIKNNIPQIGVSFISKFLYFLGRGVSVDNYPLIFDKRVATTMVRLCGLETDVYEIINIQPKTSAVSYKKYNDLIHNEAERINVEADQIEYFLFRGDI